jgi:hypothetical protein
LERLLEHCFVRNRYDFSMLSEVFGKRAFLVQCADNLREEAALGRASEEALGKLLLLVKRRRVQRDSSYLLGCKVDVGLFA